MRVTTPPVEDSIGCLHRAGWSVGDVMAEDEDGKPCWLVTGYRGDAKLRAEGGTARDAWWAATVAAGVNGGDG